MPLKNDANADDKFLNSFIKSQGNYYSPKLAKSCM